MFILLAALLPLGALAQFQPAYTVMPSHAHVCLGSDAVFSAEVTGALPITFYWIRDGTNTTDNVVSASTNSTLTVTNVQAGDLLSSFFIIASNHFGMQFSTNVVIFVADPGIATQPTNTVVAPTNTIVLSVAACGTSPFTYQWYKGSPGFALTNGGRISGADADTLYITNAAAGDSAFYWVAVTNSLNQVITSRLA